MKDTVTTETPANTFSGIIINISPNLESISVHKSLDTAEGSPIIKNFTSDNVFIKAALDLSVKPALIPMPELMVLPLIFAADISVGPSERTLSFCRFLH